MQNTFSFHHRIDQYDYRRELSDQGFGLVPENSLKLKTPPEEKFEAIHEAYKLIPFRAFCLGLYGVLHSLENQPPGARGILPEYGFVISLGTRRALFGISRVHSISTAHENGGPADSSLYYLKASLKTNPNSPPFKPSVELFSLVLDHHQLRELLHEIQLMAKPHDEAIDAIQMRNRDMDFPILARAFLKAEAKTKPLEHDKIVYGEVKDVNQADDALFSMEPRAMKGEIGMRVSALIDNANEAKDSLRQRYGDSGFILDDSQFFIVQIWNYLSSSLRALQYAEIFDNDFLTKDIYTDGEDGVARPAGEFSIRALQPVEDPRDKEEQSAPPPKRGRGRPKKSPEEKLVRIETAFIEAQQYAAFEADKAAGEVKNLGEWLRREIKRSQACKNCPNFK
ncbi:MAG: hypothetical protein AAFR73_12105 [Pseudomonadota bacterium]